MFFVRRSSAQLFRFGLLSNQRSRLFSNAVINNTSNAENRPFSNANINIDFLKDIAQENAKNGHRLLLPLADSNAMNKIMQPLTALTHEGVLPDSLKEILSANPDVFKLFLTQGNNCVKVLEAFENYCGFTLENSLRFLTEIVDNIDVKKSRDIADRLNWIAGIGFTSGPSLGRLIRKCPELLYSSEIGEIALNFDKLAGFFPKKHFMRLLTEAPHILLLPFHDTELKYEYIYFHMGIEPENLAHSFAWIDMTLEEILMRHEFAKKTGCYQTPDPKKPQIEMRNPQVHRLFDTSDKSFAVEVVGVSEAEWAVFQEMYAKLKAKEDKEEPYEKIKPSIRKQFERKIKEKLELDSDHYFTEYG